MKTVVGLFDSIEDAHRTVRDLESIGFGAKDISVVTQQEVIAHGRGEGHATGAGSAIGAGLGIITGLVSLAVPGLGIIAAIGPIIAGGILGAVAGGLVGSLVDAGVPAEEAELYNEGVRRGGTLVSVTTSDEDVWRAEEVIRRNRPVDLRERTAAWRETGWAPGQSGGAVQCGNTETAPTPVNPSPTSQPPR